MASTSSNPFDYQAKLKCITIEIETNLKAKLDTAIINLQSSVTTLKTKIDQKFNQCIKSIKATQADKMAQDNHSRELEEVTKQLSYLVSKVSILVDLSTSPTLSKALGNHNVSPMIQPGHQKPDTHQ